MRKLFVIILCIISNYLFSQPYGNEWINYNQKYFKFPITQDGIYRINRATLVNAGVPIDGTPLSFVRIYGRGQELTLYIKENNFGILDYIEFYAKRNDGWLDSTLYKPGYRHVNENLSLINDTAYYFFTWGTSPSTKRYTIETDVNHSNYSNISYCIRNDVVNYPYAYYTGNSGPEYTEAEGWFDYPFGLGQTISKNLNTYGAVTNSGINTEIEYAVATANSPSSNYIYNHHLQVELLGNTILDTSLSGYKLVKKKYNFSSSSLSSSLEIKFKSINDLGASVDRVAVSHIKYSYPRNFDFQNNPFYTFTIPQFAGAKATLGITYNTIASGYVIYDISNNKKLTPVYDNGIVYAVVPNSNGKANCVFANADSVKYVSVVKAINGTGLFTNYTNQEINSDYLIISHPKLWAEAQNYKTYRNLKGFTTALVNIEELYDQFAYGISKHPLSIRNYVNYAYNNWSKKPEHLLLLGKSIHSHYVKYNSSLNALSLVPSFGYPSSDNLITSGLGNSLKYEQLLSTGRISAENNNEVKIYLDKVKDFEINQPDEWMKKVIHFGGGGNSSEQLLFANYLRTFEDIIEDTLFGGNVTTFLKQTSSPIQITQSDSVKNLLNSGTSLITFFGHGSTTAGFDQNIDHPSYFNNKNKYPLMVANSCFAGDIHLNLSSISEEWIFIANKGAVGFLASVGEAYAQYLYEYTKELYKNISYKKYGEPLGDIIKNTCAVFLQNYSSNSYVINTCLEFTLHGDPAIVLNSPLKPDLKVSSSSIQLNPNPISSEDDSIEVKVIVSNIGKAITNEFIVEIKRTFPDGSSDLYTKGLVGCIYKDTVLFTIPVEHTKGTGLNKIEANVDLMNEIDEISEINNYAYIDFIITSSDITPIFPYNFAIVPNSQITLKASTGNPFSGNVDYIFQIDTTDLFNSSFLQSKVINSDGGIVNWSLPFTLIDSTVYYWRVSIVPSGNNDYAWKESSFIYIPNKTGWSQGHFFQFKNDNLDFFNYNRNQRSFDFITYPRELHCHNVGSPGTYSQFDAIRYTIDNSIGDGLGDYTCCGTPAAMMVVVIDSTKIRSWPSDIYNYGHRDYPKCFSRGRPDYYFIFNTDSLGLANMANMINSIDNGNYILVYNFRDGNFANWPEVAYQAMENIGAMMVRNIATAIPYIYFVQKGAISTKQEILGSSISDEIDLYANLYSRFTYGEIKTNTIGPSTNWKSFHWNSYNGDALSYDSARVDIIGINANTNNEELVYSEISVNEPNIFNLADSINSSLYQYLKLNFYTRDDSIKTPIQLKKWQLMYDEVPETAINPKSGYSFYADTISEGDNVRFKISTLNISPYDMDSLLVKYWILDKNNNYIPIITKRLKTHPAGTVITDSVEYSTKNLEGLNSIWVEFNPVNSSTSKYDQLEQYHFNNIAQKFFYVNSDKVNPLLDVTFDGFHILNGDIVSTKPQIVVKLKDENKFLALDDTSSFAVYLKTISTGEEKRIYFLDSIGNKNLDFIPADLPNNSCKIIYNPSFTDGKYELRIQAKDISNNESGINDYNIMFEVITKSTITDIFNYPNPFSTSTRFVFTLTGSEIPDEITIQILTISGKLVNSINLNDVGNIHIGRNITDYAWDGKDMYGDQLANGVYFYRVITKLNGQELEKRKTGAENYFKHGFGKMYLMR